MPTINFCDTVYITVGTLAVSGLLSFVQLGWYYAWFPALRIRSSIPVSVTVYVIVSALPFRSTVAVSLPGTERIRKRYSLELDPNLNGNGSPSASEMTYCVEWGVKLYSLTQRLTCVFLRELRNSYAILTNKRNSYVFLKRNTKIRIRMNGYVMLETRH